MTTEPKLCDIAEKLREINRVFREHPRLSEYQDEDKFWYDYNNWSGLMYQAIAASQGFAERVREATEWQDISTAPKDGTFVDLWMPDMTDGFNDIIRTHRVPDCCFVGGAWLMGGDFEFKYLEKATHYKLIIPPSPSNTTKVEP